MPVRGRNFLGSASIGWYKEERIHTAMNPPLPQFSAHGNVRILTLVFLCLGIGVPAGLSQESEGLMAAGPASGEDEGALANALIGSAWETRPDARSLHLKVPAPRGQIVDRFGEPFAQNKIGYFLAIQLPAGLGLSDAEVLALAHEQFAIVNSRLSKDWGLDDEEILNHYRNRRWLPLLFSPMLTSQEISRIESKVDDTLWLFPTYQRVYPQGNSACHMIGYSGRKSKGSRKMLVSGEPLYPPSEGRDGLELTFDEYLQGTPGEIHSLFDTQGNEISKEQVTDPVPGETVVMTLDMQMQKLAESTLRRYCRRGAFVVLEVQSGDVLAMASNPTFDPNAFVPGISEEAFAKLQEDKNLPLFARAFRGVYPPASTFKVPVALAALEAGTVDRFTTIDCPPQLKVGDRYFHNWHRSGEGKLGVVAALMRSCNTWFYKVGLQTGADNVSSMAFRLGFGEATGLPLRAEAAGFIPTNESMMSRYGYALSHGYLANACIGQGHVLATPLQVAQMMAGIGNRRALPQVRLVQQVQDNNGKVIKHFPVQDRHPINVSHEYLDLVTRGLVEVVHGSRGTAPAAANSYYTVAGKTGTGQWGAVSKKQYVAWFAGFVPAENPRYAFVALYEGNPGESLSGGKNAAPMVSSFFNKFYGGGMHLRHGGYPEVPDGLGTIAEYGDGSRRSVTIRSRDGSWSMFTAEGRQADVSVRRALPLVQPIPEKTQPAAQPSTKPKRRGFFRRR